jgi:heme A synthase
MRSKLSTIWIFLVLNYLYCDIVTLMDPELLPQFLAGRVEGTAMSMGFLLGAAILIEIPIAMVLASRVVEKQEVNRWANIVAGAIMTVVQAATLFMGTPAPYYVFFSAIEITTTAFIVWYAWRWRTEAARPVEAAESSL